MAKKKPEDPPYLKLEYMKNWPAQAGQMLTRIGSVNEPDGDFISEGLLATLMAHYDLSVMVLESPSLSVAKRCSGAVSAILTSIIIGNKNLNYATVEQLILAKPLDIHDALSQCWLVKIIATVIWPSGLVRSAGVKCLRSAALVLNVHIDVPHRLTRTAILTMCDHVQNSYNKQIIASTKKKSI